MNRQMSVSLSESYYVYRIIYEYLHYHTGITRTSRSAKHVLSSCLFNRAASERIWFAVTYSARQLIGDVSPASLNQKASE